MMTENEFKKKMKELGWNEAVIQEAIKSHKEAELQGIVIPYEMDLIEAPIGYPCGPDIKIKQ